jgi:hypothetical protein
MSTSGRNDTPYLVADVVCNKKGAASIDDYADRAAQSLTALIEETCENVLRSTYWLPVSNATKTTL